jgi:hypothetical protein
MKALQPDLCYLCGKSLSEPTDRDHIPLKALFPPKIRQRHKPTKMVTVRVHKTCNKSYHFDEQYFLYSLYPFAVGAYVGDEMHKHIREKFRAGKNKKLIAMNTAKSDDRGRKIAGSAIGLRLVTISPFVEAEEVHGRTAAAQLVHHCRLLTAAFLGPC